MKKILLIFCAFIFTELGYSQHTMVLNPISDCYVVTYGGGLGKNSFLKFNISSIPADAVLTSTKLRAFVSSTSLAWDGDVRIIHYSNQTWIEGDSSNFLWQLAYFADTITQLLGFGSAPGWAETVDLNTFLNVDFQAPNTFFSLLLKDVDDPTCCPNLSSLSIDDNDSMMVGNIFNDNIVFRPREWVNSPPQLVIDYGIPPTVAPSVPISPVCAGTNVVLTISATGDAPLAYQWQFNGINIPGANSNSYSIINAQLINAGNYTCVVANAYGTDISDVITLVVNSNPILTVTGTNVTCNGACDGTASVSTIGGSLPYFYIWSNGAISSPITNLCPNSYSPTVTDGNGCSATGTVIISEPQQLLAIVTSQTDIYCYGSCNGTATIMVAGGTPGYTYLWGANTGGQTTATAVNLCAGSYSCTVSDSNLCSTTVSVNINQPTQLIVNTTSTNVTCYGLCDGTGSAVISGGTLPYFYLWNNLSTQSSLTGLCPGVYCCTITDANGCYVTACFTITEPPQLTSVTSSTDDTGGNGTATVIASDGTPSYTYLWDDSLGQITATAINLFAGWYHVTVTDANGCSITDSVVVLMNTGITNQNMNFNYTLFPNPVKTDLYLKLTTFKAEDISIIIYNNLGDVILNKNISLINGNNLQNFDLQQLNSGIYFIKLQGITNNSYLKFIKTE